ncbi:MAG: 5-deoxy-glucuronate isomerase [Spirochaetaceae bacterium]|nr:5-deoxy-glucuronate isomerase [Spirochaetaceae bacterium]
MLLRHRGLYAPGYEPIVDRAGPNADILMDFGVLTLRGGEEWSSGEADEKAFLLISGEVELSWPGGAARAARASLLDESPSVLSLAAGAWARIVAGAGGAVLAVIRTDNAKPFPSRFYGGAECRSEERGKGTLREASTRIVRTCFDDSDAPLSNLVLGEVVNAPGKWSSYPPHHHPQPEIYHYRLLPSAGFGLARVGEEAYLVRDGDTILIRSGQDHPMVAAPGYAMWYLWVIRHLDGKRYANPDFAFEHLWTTQAGARIWVAPSERAGGVIR